MRRDELMELLGRVRFLAVHDDREDDMDEPVLSYRRLEDGRWQETNIPRKISVAEVAADILQWAEEEGLKLEYLYTGDDGVAHILGIAE